MLAAINEGLGYSLRIPLNKEHNVVLEKLGEMCIRDSNRAGDCSGRRFPVLSGNLIRGLENESDYGDKTGRNEASGGAGAQDYGAGSGCLLYTSRCV